MRFFSFYCYGAHRHLHSFPTRRSSDLVEQPTGGQGNVAHDFTLNARAGSAREEAVVRVFVVKFLGDFGDRKSTRLNSSHTVISYAVFCLKKKKQRKSSSFFSA